MINTVKTIDLEYQIPYWYGIRNCPTCRAADYPDFDDTLFEKQYVQYAKGQIDWLIGPNFVIPHLNGGVTVKNSTKGFLKAAEFIANYVKEDLSDSLWNLKFACAIESLDILNQQLATHNAGNVGYFGDDRIAVNASYDVFIGLSRETQFGCGY